MAEDIDDLLDEIESKFCKKSGPIKSGKKANAHTEVAEQSRYIKDSFNQYL